MESCKSEDGWIWMPHPGHYSRSHECRFHLNTYTNGYIISTVGELWPPDNEREIIAKSRGITLRGIGDARASDYMKKIGFHDVGFNRQYETMVFHAQRNLSADTQCCPYIVANHSEIQVRGYNTAMDAYRGHLALCTKYGAKVIRNNTQV